VTQRSGITGEKMEIDGYNILEGDNVEVYDHMGKHTLCTMVQTNKENQDAGHKVAMQVAAMKPVALDKESVEQKILDEEYKTAVEKTKLEQVEKFIEMKLKKAGLNPNLVDSEDHIESNMAKGWLTQAQADEARKIIADAKVEGEAQLKMPMIENIAKGRVQKFLKENCLVDQEFQFGDGDKATVAQWLAKQDKDLKITAFKRFTLIAD
jgi:elongation factor Ts